MEDYNTLIRERIRKLNEFKDMGVDPYAHRYEKKDNASDLQKNFKKLKAGEKTEVRAKSAGRLTALRRMGKVTFAKLIDETGSIQLYFSQDDLGKDKYKLLKKFDIGDIIGIEGVIFKTNRGEVTINAQSYDLLTKSLHPLPEKYHGLKDTELRYRQRYVDLIVNPDVRETFKTRTRIFQLMRDFLIKKGFMEVETPILQPVYGGAAARPFITHHNTLKQDMYLRISDELYLKRLLVGGFEKVFEFCKDFRNEGIDTQHNPEFTLMETMCAYADYKDSMKLTEEMISFIAEKVLGTTKITYQGNKIDLAPPWNQITMVEAVKEHTGYDFEKINELNKAREIAKKLKVEITDDMSIGYILAEICSELVEPKLIQPTFITDHPYDVSILAKKKKDNPKYTERFELIINGMEFANVYSELNDPELLRKSWTTQEKLLEKGDDEAQKIDHDFLKALEYGMPPASGIGIGMDRLIMLLTDSPSIRDVILFPTLRSEE